MNVAILYFDINTGYYPSFNHGIASLIGQLKNINIDVSLYHIKNMKDIETTTITLVKSKMDILGLSFATNQKKYVSLFLKKYKKQGFIITGGVHSTLLKERMFDEFTNLDAVCIGEGDFAFINLIENMSKNTDFYNSPSIIFKKDNEIIKNNVAPLTDLNNLSSPDYSLFNFNKILKDNAFVFPMLLGRGCPYACSYCCNHSIKDVYPNKNVYVRWPSIPKAIETIKSNLNLCPSTKKIAFADDTFTLNKKWLSEFCIAYKKEIDLPFLCNGRVETIDEEVLGNLKTAGCKSIDYGVETGNEWLRKTILHRNYSNEKIMNAFKLTKKYNIKSFSFNITGLPFETCNMAKDTLTLNQKLLPSFGKCFYFYPFEGTKIYNICKEFNLLPESEDEVSGYLEKPIIKPIFMTTKDMKYYCEKMQLFFYLSLISKYLPGFKYYNKILLNILTIVRAPILLVVKPQKNNIILWKIRQFIRKFVLKLFR